MIFPFEREAEQGAPMPDGLSLPDQLAFRFCPACMQVLERDL